MIPGIKIQRVVRGVHREGDIGIEVSTKDIPLVLAKIKQVVDLERLLPDFKKIGGAASFYEGVGDSPLEASLYIVEGTQDAGTSRLVLKPVGISDVVSQSYELQQKALGALGISNRDYSRN